MTDTFEVDVGTYQRWKSNEAGVLTRDCLDAAVERLEEVQRRADLRPFNLVVAKALVDQLKAMGMDK